MYVIWCSKCEMETSMAAEHYEPLRLPEDESKIDLYCGACRTETWHTGTPVGE